MEKTTRIGGAPVFYRQAGEGKTILILHGWGSNSDTWRITQHELAQRGFRVVVPDLPGFGQSQEPSTDWSLQEYSEFVHQFAQQLNLQSYTLVGHSFGGRIGLDYAVRYPREVQQLVLCGAAGVTRHKRLRARVFLGVTKIGNAIFSIPGLRFLRSTIRQLWYGFTQEQDYYQASARMQAVMRNVLEENLRPRLPHITAHTLLLWGGDDTVTPLSDAHIMHTTIPLSQLHIFPHAHHGLQLEVPIQLAKHISRFVRTH
jgi:pimeloyl-ACP methyl ester carboxylesterase